MKNLKELILDRKDEVENLYYSIVNNYMSIDELEESTELNYTVAYHDETDIEEDSEEVLEDLNEDYLVLLSILEELENK